MTVGANSVRPNRPDWCYQATIPPTVNKYQQEVNKAIYSDILSHMSLYTSSLHFYQSFF